MKCEVLRFQKTLCSTELVFTRVAYIISPISIVFLDLCVTHVYPLCQNGGVFREGVYEFRLFSKEISGPTESAIFIIKILSRRRLLTLKGPALIRRILSTGYF
jgi:hypothetical protein